MITGIKKRTIVGKNGTINLQTPELTEGTEVEIIILIEDQEEDTTTYLLSNPVNRQHLIESMENVEKGENLITINAEDWYEKYCF